VTEVLRFAPDLVSCATGVTARVTGCDRTRQGLW